jgi:hypothetical protein
MKLSVQMEKLLAERAAENCELKFLQIEVFSKIPLCQLLSLFRDLSKSHFKQLSTLIFWIHTEMVGNCCLCRWQHIKVILKNAEKT